MKYFHFMLLVLLAVHVYEQQKKPIIDMHLHAHEVGKYFPEENRLTGDMAPESTEDLRNEVLAALERNNVVLALTSGPMIDSYRGGATKIIAGCGLLGPDNIDTQLKQFIEWG